MFPRSWLCEVSLHRLRRVRRLGLSILAGISFAWLQAEAIGAQTLETASANELLFEATFEGTARPSYGRSIQDVSGTAHPIKDGKVGGGLSVPDSAILFYTGAASGMDERGGKIDFWLRPRWPDYESRIRRVFEVDFDKHKKLKLFRDPKGRFGVTIVRPFGKDGRKVQQVRTEPFRNLSPNEWHHVEISWRGHRLELRIDGARIASEPDAQLAFASKGNLRLYGSDFDIDSIRLYRDRETGPGPQPGLSVEQTTPGREFVEPESLYRVAGISAGDSLVDWRAKPLFSDFEPSDGWPAASSAPLSLTLSPGRDATAAVLIAARRHIGELHLEVSDFKPTTSSSSVGLSVELPSKVLRVVRTFERTIYNGPPDEVESVARFVTPWTTQGLRAGHFQEVWIRIEAPSTLEEGSYSGVLSASSGEDRISIPLTLEVRRYPLDLEGPKKLGIYYYFEDKLFDEAEVRRELADLRSHGIQHLITDLQIQYGPADQDYRAHFAGVRRGLELIREAGFDDLVVIENGLKRVLNWREKEFKAGPATDPVFAEVVDRTMDELNMLQREFMDFDLYQTHLDEVFSGEGRLDSYIDVSRHIKRRSKVPLYITLNTVRPSSNALRQRLGPFVDYRAYHGYSFEWWLARNNRVRELEIEHTRSGDRASFYHNSRGPHFSARRSRIVNGILLWAGPFESHAPWIYQKYYGNPLDDRDGREHDIGMAFPGPNDSLVSSRIWEATREGWIDLRHLQTLERLILERFEALPRAAGRASQTLEKIRALVREAGPPPRNNFAGLRKNARGGLYISQPRRPYSLADEAPLLSALDLEFGSDGLDHLRATLATHISELDSQSQKSFFPPRALPVDTSRSIP